MVLLLIRFGARFQLLHSSILWLEALRLPAVFVRVMKQCRDRSVNPMDLLIALDGDQGALGIVNLRHIKISSKFSNKKRQIGAKSKPQERLSAG